MLRNNTRAPEFTLRDEFGEERSLSDLQQGGPLVLLFTRFTGCPTSQRDLLAYGNVYDRLQALGADLVAVSADTPQAHADLKERFELPFTLLSDAGFRVSERYGVYRSDDVEEGPQPHGEPAVFILDVDGNIAYSQVMTGPKGIASPAEMALVVLYMAANGGRY